MATASYSALRAGRHHLGLPSNDRITLWNFDTDAWAGIACEYAGRNLIRDEWSQFGPRTIEYRATCPDCPIES